MAVFSGSAPVLSTPDTRISEGTCPVSQGGRPEQLSEAQLEIRYEIMRTIAEIKKQRWTQVALQFSDEMLPDSVRVFQLLARGLEPFATGLNTSSGSNQSTEASAIDGLTTSTEKISIEDWKPTKLTILADTSYGSCCVDEIAAEHVKAEAIIHYGRACLSPIARLPVLHVFTKRDLDHISVVEAFIGAFADHKTKIILTADIPYANHIQPIHGLLLTLGYSQVFPATIVHDLSSPIPNRTVPDLVRTNPAELQKYQLFHISDPPTSLLLTLSSKVASIEIYPTTSPSTTPPSSILASTTSLLRRRYALVASLSTVSTWGILINTLSVKNYLGIVEHVKKQISNARKKSYIFVVGKLNAAKLANFSEVGGWVSIGCWESSLIDSKDFYKPVITPFELGLALQSDSERLWTGQWSGDFQSILDKEEMESGQIGGEDSAEDRSEGDYDTEEESAPPDFDLRTGKYVSQGRLSALNNTPRRLETSSHPQTLAKRANGDVVAVNGVASMGADYLQTKRTWQGLGSDIEVCYEEGKLEQGSIVEEGRSGIARGYTVGGSKRT